MEPALMQPPNISRCEAQAAGAFESAFSPGCNTESVEKNVNGRLRVVGSRKKGRPRTI